MAGGAKLYIVHLSNHLGMQYIELAKQNGAREIFVETCPQYLMLSDERYYDEDGVST